MGPGGLSLTCLALRRRYVLMPLGLASLFCRFCRGRCCDPPVWPRPARTRVGGTARPPGAFRRARHSGFGGAGGQGRLRRVCWGSRAAGTASATGGPTGGHTDRRRGRVAAATGVRPLQADYWWLAGAPTSRLRRGKLWRGERAWSDRAAPNAKLERSAEALVSQRCCPDGDALGGDSGGAGSRDGSPSSSPYSP